MHGGAKAHSSDAMMFLLSEGTFLPNFSDLGLTVSSGDVNDSVLKWTSERMDED